MKRVRRMVDFFKNFFAVLVFGLAEAWFLKGYFAGNFEFEPLIAFLAAATVLICKDGLEKYFSLNVDQVERDRELYELFACVLDGGIHNLKFITSARVKA